MLPINFLFSYQPLTSGKVTCYLGWQSHTVIWANKAVALRTLSAAEADNAPQQDTGCPLCRGITANTNPPGYTSSRNLALATGPKLCTYPQPDTVLHLEPAVSTYSVWSWRCWGRLHSLHTMQPDLSFVHPLINIH